MANTIVLIPHYNNLKSLRRTLMHIHHKNSIDILVIDDGSDLQQTPNTDDLKKDLNLNVSLEILKLSKNKGITYALNYGLNHILKHKKHLFIARIDCGDICVPDRFEIQETFLLEHKDVGVVGSWVRWINSNGKQVFCKKPPTTHKKIKQMMSVRCSLIHSSTMYRTSIVKEIGKYPSNYEAAEDYAYFFKIAKHTQTANIPQFLTNVEHNTQGISITKRKDQSKSKLKIILNYSPLNLYTIYGITYNLFLMSIGSATVLKLKTKIFNN